MFEVERADDRRVISDIVHVLKNGGRWLRLPARVWSSNDGL
jgi:hypothetical protein